MEWQPIEGHSHYEVNTIGDVREIVSGRVLGQWRNSQGYCLVRLSRPRVAERVHRLVAAAFLPNPDMKPSVNHINNDRADNRADNLEWCTQRENLAHARRQGRMPDNYWTGKRSPSAALGDDDVCRLRALRREGWSLGKLAFQFGVSKRAVGRCVHKETYADV